MSIEERLSMTRPRSSTTPGALPWRAATATGGRTAAGSAAALLHLAEAATLASAAGLRSVHDLTRLSRTPATSQATPPATPQATPPADPDTFAHPEPDTDGADAAATEPVALPKETDLGDVDDTEGGQAPQDEAPQDEAPQDEGLDAPLVPHWDELNLARIRGRLPRLSLDEVKTLLAYEHAHASRPQVLTMLENRIRKIEGHAVVGPDEQEPAPAG